MLILKNKNILLGVTGSIAAYKALELARLFVKAGANVRVLMSEDAKRFITPLSFEAISRSVVLHSQTENWGNDNNHIFINKWADIFVIAPATANTINKLSSGIADNLLTSTALAFTKPIIIAPSANSAMFLHQTTQDSIEKLNSFGHYVLDSQNKLLACGDNGNGGLAEVKEIFFRTAKILLSNPFWNGRNVVVSGGGTIEKIDDVRFVSNFSSGKMAESLALALFLRGALVTYIQSASINEPDLPIKRIFVKSSDEMSIAMKSVLSELKDKKQTPFVFMAAAVSDYKPANIKSGKLKKDNLGENFNIEFIKTEDLLLNLDKNGLKTVGFKAEFDVKEAENHAYNMLEVKNLDAVCLNIIDNVSNPFGSDDNAITFISRKLNTRLDKKSKSEISFEILKLCEEL